MITFELSGVLETGADRSAELPPEDHQPLRIYRGEDAQVRLTVTDSSDRPVTLTGGSLAMTVRRAFLDTDEVLATKTGALVPSEGSNVATFTFTPADFKEQQPGRYVFDIWFTDSGGARSPVVPASAFVVSPSIAAVP